jgi:hypothetical protein
MSNNKTKKKVYSKPIVKKPVEEKIEEQVEEVTEAKAIDPEVFETKLFVEEEPEEFVEISGEEELIEMPEQKKEVELVKDEVVVPKEINFEFKEDYFFGTPSERTDKQTEIEMIPEEEPEKQTELIKGDELKEKLEEIKTKIEEFQTIQVVPVSPELEPEPMYTLTPEQEEKGAKVIAEMVNNSILEDLKALASEPPKERTLASLSNNELRYFHRTGQMPK